MNLHIPKELPISEKQEEIIQAIKKHQVFIIAGDTGSGKTTQLPKMCLLAGQGKDKIIACTQPRRLAALSVANRVAEEMAAPDMVAAAIRFQDNSSASTRVKFMTDGLLLAETRRDRLLKRYDTIIIDEAHERSLNIDFLLGYLKQLLCKRDNLKIIISSATIDTDKFSKHFNQAPVYKVSGRLFPIDIKYHEEVEEENIVELVCSEVKNICATPGGDILVFMATERDILDSKKILQEQLDATRHLVLPLFGRLQGQEQSRIFKPAKQRKIILATNIAETSITVPGIKFVVDTGTSRLPVYSIRSGTTSLKVRKISQASCQQRSGRAGRTGPGTSVRLYSEENFLNRPQFTRPEIQRSNLAQVILQMISLGLGDPRKFPFIDPPTPRAISEGFKILRELGAINHDNRITETGRTMATLPLDPRYSRVILEAIKLDCLPEIIIICAGLSVQDPRMRPLEKEQLAKSRQKEFVDPRSDFITLLNIWQKYHSEGKTSNSLLSKFCKKHFLSWQRMREWFDIHDQLHQQLKRNRNLKNLSSSSKQEIDYENIHKALTCGFLRNIGKKKEKNIFTMAGEREVYIFPGSTLYNCKQCEWIIAADIVETSRLFARTTAIIEPDWLEPLAGELCRYSYSEPFWSKKSGQVQANERVTLFGLPIVSGRKVNFGRINKQYQKEAQAVFIHQALIEGNLRGKYDFLDHNLQIVKELEQWEERVRRRNLRVDDQVLYDFYQKRLTGVYDRFTLNRLIKRKKGDKFLFMNKDEITNSEVDANDLYNFPQTIRAGSVEISLSYSFSPGKEHDGITAIIPIEHLTLINPTVFEWLVPGMLEEKIVVLLKKLPKSLRKRLVPIPEAATRIMDRIDIYNGSLYPALEKVIRREYNVEVRRMDWQADELPKHLRMQYRLIDERGKLISETYNFNQLVDKKKRKTPNRSDIIPAKGKQGRNKNISIMVTDLKDLSSPELPNPISQVKTDDNGLPLFPCLITTSNDTISFGYTGDENEAHKQNTEGLKKLYLKQFTGAEKQLNKLCKQSIVQYSASWLALSITMKPGEISQALSDFIMAEIFGIKSGIIPEKEDFQERVNLIKAKGFNKQVSEIIRLVCNILTEKRSTIQAIKNWQERVNNKNRFDKEMEEEFKQNMEAILPVDFLHSRNLSEIEGAERYFKALRIRIERAILDPGKDQKKQQRLRDFTGKMNQLKQYENMNSHESCQELVTLYRIMLEEFKISVFAPEIKTAMVVSEKRLNKLWHDIENNCTRVE